MKTGDAFPGLIGWEYHNDPPADLPVLEVVAAGIAWQDAVWSHYSRPHGPDARAQRIAENLLRRGVGVNHSMVLCRKPDMRLISSMSWQ